MKKYIDVHFNPSSGTDPRYPEVITEIIQALQTDAYFKDLKLYRSKLIGIVDAAGRWDMCAVGSLCWAIPRRPITGSPYDEILHEKGILFDNYLTDALWLLDTVERMEDESNITDASEIILFKHFEQDIIESKLSPTNYLLKHPVKCAIYLLQSAISIHQQIEERADQILKNLYPNESSWSQYCIRIENLNKQQLS